MLVELSVADIDARGVQTLAASAEEAGIDRLVTPEIVGDPFLPLMAAALVTDRIQLGTAIAVAFPRSPMVVAGTAWALQVNSKGRFSLGLGTQVKGHNERRFSVPWKAPASRLREYVESLHAIWRCWERKTPLSYEGEHYRFTLMTPEFSPKPTSLPRIPVYLAAVRPRMIALAGAVADGVRIHPFCTRRYLEEVAMPNLERGLAEAGRDRSQFEVCGGGFLAIGRDESEVHRAREWVRTRVAFYGSTKAYRPVMELHGWNDLATKLYRMSVTGRWKEMPAQVPDDVLDEFVAAGTHDQIADAVRARFGGLVDTVAVGTDEPTINPELASAVAEIQRLDRAFESQSAEPA